MARGDVRQGMTPSTGAGHTSARTRMRIAAEIALTASGFGRLSRFRVRNGTLVLAYHNVVPRGEPVVGDRSLHLPVDDFAAQLDALMKTHDVVSLADALTGPGMRHGRPAVAITFDDAYQGAVTSGVDELAKRGLPATLFVAPAYVGGRAFWWDRLAAALGEVPDHQRVYALEALNGDGEQVLRWASPNMNKHSLPRHACCADEETLIDACHRHPGITVGSHSWSHVNLARVGPERLEAELTQSAAWLQARFTERVIPVLAYPYGRFSTGVEAAAARAGYRAALRVDGGWITSAPTNAFAISRLNVPAGVTHRGFALRAAGMFC